MQMDITGCENIWINILESNIIGTIYRHPKNDIPTFK